MPLHCVVAKVCAEQFGEILTIAIDIILLLTLVNDGIEVKVFSRIKPANLDAYFWLLARFIATAPPKLLRRQLRVRTRSTRRIRVGDNGNSSQIFILYILQT